MRTHCHASSADICRVLGKVTASAFIHLPEQRVRLYNASIGRAGILIDPGVAYVREMSLGRFEFLGGTGLDHRTRDTTEAFA